MRNKSLLYFDEEKSNENFLYFTFILDIKINEKTTLNGKKNNTFKKKILKIKTGSEKTLLEQFSEEFDIIKKKYFTDENGTPFVPNFFIETNSDEIFKEWQEAEKKKENDIFAGYLSSCIFTHKTFSFGTIEDIIEYLED